MLMACGELTVDCSIHFSKCGQNTLPRSSHIFSSHFDHPCHSGCSKEQCLQTSLFSVNVMAQRLLHNVRALDRRFNLKIVSHLGPSDNPKMIVQTCPNESTKKDRRWGTKVPALNTLQIRTLRLCAHVGMNVVVRPLRYHPGSPFAQRGTGTFQEAHRLSETDRHEIEPHPSQPRS